MPQSQNYTRNSSPRSPLNGPGLRSLFPFVIISAALFVWLTSLSLPEVTASHFVASGAANGFMPKHIYTRFMLGLMVMLAVLIAYLPGLTMHSPNARINIPHRDYWLAPERREATVQYLCQSMKVPSMLLIAFLCYVHWLVVKANTLSPPLIPPQAIIPAIVLLILAMLFWSWYLVKPFRNIP